MMIIVELPVAATMILIMNNFSITMVGININNVRVGDDRPMTMMMARTMMMTKMMMMATKFTMIV